MNSGRWTLIVCVFVVGSSGCKGAEKAAEKPKAAQSAPVKEKATTPPAPTAPRTPPAAAATPSSETALDLRSHQFYGVYLSGHKAGWAEERVEQLDDGGIRLTTLVQLRIKRMGNVLNMKLSDQVEYARLPDGAIRRFAMTEQSGAGRVVRSGEVRGDTLHISLVTPTGRTEKTMPRPKERAADTLPLLLVRRLKEAGSEPITAWQFDRQQLKDVSVVTTLVSEKETRINGVPVTVLQVKGVDKTRGITMTNRVTKEGRTLEMTLGPGLKLVLEDEALAKNPAVSVPDLYRLSVVPLDKRLGDPASVRRMKVRLSGLPSDGVSLKDSRQTREGEVVEVHRRDLSALPQQPLSDEDRAKWLLSTPFVDHDDAEVAALAGRVTKGKTDAQKVVAMTKAVNKALSYTLATAPLTASQILKEGRGDCTEYARLLTAMARAIGLPAREVSGMAYAGDSDPGFAFHAWVEVYVSGRWLAVDPTWNEVPIDGTHIALSRDDPSAIIGLLGGLKAQLLDIER